MSYAVIRVRGTLRIKPDIKDTLKLLRLNQVNHCIIVPETVEYKGMLKKAKDYITWGEIKADVMENLVKERGRLKGKIPLTNEFVKKNTSCKTIKDLSEAVCNGDLKLGSLEDLKKVFRLHPPRKGGYEGIKRSFKVGGALGYRGEAINDLLVRMI